MDGARIGVPLVASGASTEPTRRSASCTPSHGSGRRKALHFRFHRAPERVGGDLLHLLFLVHPLDGLLPMAPTSHPHPTHQRVQLHRPFHPSVGRRGRGPRGHPAGTFPAITRGTDMEAVRLRDGVATMPRVGVGTYRMGGEELVHVVRAAAKARPEGLLVDTARAYRNERAVAAALEGCPHAFVVTKVSPKAMGSYEDVRKSVHDSLQDLRRTQLDLVLLHWPGASKLPPDSSLHSTKRAVAWQALEDLHREGLARAIGVSNFTERHIKELEKVWSIAPHVNQVEMHPMIPQDALLRTCSSFGIHTMAYSPLGAGALLQDETVNSIAERLHSTPAQVLVRWCLQKGASCVVKSASAERMVSNLQVAGLELNAQDMEELKGMTRGGVVKFCWDPETIL